MGNYGERVEKILSSQCFLSVHSSTCYFFRLSEFCVVLHTDIVKSTDLSEQSVYAAEMVGGIFAGLTAIHLYGDHAKWIDPLMPWGDKHHDKNTSMHAPVSLVNTILYLYFYKYITYLYSSFIYCCMIVGLMTSRSMP